MGRYINQTSTGLILGPLGKARALINDGAIMQSTPKYIPGKSVCVVNNYVFEAAAYAYDEDEFMVFLNDDTGRPRIFLEYEWAEQLSQ